MKKLRYTLLFILFPIILLGQNKINFQLAKLLKQGKLKAVARTIKVVSENNKEHIQVSENKDEGIVWLPLKNFKNGTIEIEMRGKDVLQKSFIGVVFHGQNDTTYDAVYCRPFNFLAKDAVRKIHAIQYISHPLFTWKKLREERNGEFEKEIVNPPNPNEWFTMKIVIDDKIISAYINNSENPSLTVKKLSSNNYGKLGLFTGDNSGGDFRNVVVKHQPN